MVTTAEDHIRFQSLQETHPTAGSDSDNYDSKQIPVRSGPKVPDDSQSSRGLPYPEGDVVTSNGKQSMAHLSRERWSTKDSVLTLGGAYTLDILR
ncbi:uncharacterized [Tachysurus ichikawai]